MRSLIILVLLLIAHANNVQTQKVISDYGQFHDCGYIFKAPKGTVSYHDLVSDLGSHWEDGHPDLSQVPRVAFLLKTFYTVQFGSVFSGGPQGTVSLLIHAVECNDLTVTNKNKIEYHISQLSAYLFLPDKRDLKPDDAVNWLRRRSNKKLLEAISNGSEILIIAKPNGYSSSSVENRLRHVYLMFAIEKYQILK